MFNCCGEVSDIISLLHALYSDEQNSGYRGLSRKEPTAGWGLDVMTTQARGKSRNIGYSVVTFGSAQWYL